MFQYAHADAGVLLLMRTEEPTELRQGFPIPVVLVNQRADGSVVDCVIADDQRGGYLATEHLVALGHRLIAHVTGPENISSIAERCNGYEGALRRHGLWTGDGLMAGPFSDWS